MDNKSKPRIFIGVTEIGDFVLRLAQGFRELGFETTSIVWKKNRPLLERSEKHDGYIKRSKNRGVMLLRSLRVFFKVLFRHDIFIFNFADSFILLFYRRGYLNWLNNHDMAMLKLLGKKIVVVTQGCDVRHYIPNEKWAKDNGIKYHVCGFCGGREACSLVVKQRKVRKIEKYADYIFSNPEYGQLFRRDYILIRFPFNLSSVRCQINSTSEPLILHAPSDPTMKGTKYVLEAVEKLKEEGYSFKFLLCQNMKNEDVKAKLAESEIVIDQLLAPGHGLFAIEAMASGNVVLGSAPPGRFGFPEDLPIITTTPDNIYDNLKMVLDNPQLRFEIARKGRAYVEKYHDHVQVAKYLVEQIGEGKYLQT